MSKEWHCQYHAVELHVLGEKQGEAPAQTDAENISRNVAQMRIGVQKFLEQCNMVLDEDLVVGDDAASIAVAVAEVPLIH